MISRRTVLAGLGSLPAVGGTTAAVIASEPEHAVTRVNRLAEELSFAMDDWMAEMSVPMIPYGKYAHWIAHIHPASATEYAIGFENVRARRIETPEERHARAQRELIEATKALYPEVTDWRVVRADDEDDGSKIVGMFMMLGHRDRKPAT